MYGKPLTEEHKKKMSDFYSQIFWWNNGTTNKRSKECPEEGYILGRIKRKE